MDKTIDRVIRLYIALLGVLFVGSVAVFIAASLSVSRLDTKILDISDEWYIVQEEGDIPINLHSRPEQAQQRSVSIRRLVDERVLENQTIIFYSMHGTIRVFLNDREVYHSHAVKGSPIWNRGWHWNIVQLPYDLAAGDVIRIELVRSFEGDYGHILPHEIYSARVSDFFDFILKKSVLSMLASVLIFLISIVVLSLCYMRRAWGMASRELFYVGGFAVGASIYFLFRNPWITWVFNDVEVLSTVVVYAGLLSLLPLLYLCMEQKYSMYTNAYRLLILLTKLYLAAKLGLELSGRVGLFVENPIDEMFCGGVVLLMLLLLYRNYRKHRSAGIAHMILPLTIMYVVMLSDWILLRIGIHYFGNNLIGLLLLVDVALVAHFSTDSLELTYKNVQDAQKYQMLAELDIMTGLANRNGYMKCIEELQGKGELAIIIMDVNNLKFVNDNFGHAEGDAMLVEIAHTVQATFREPYRCFRIGGDEFAVLVQDKDAGEIEGDIWAFEKEIRRLNEEKEYTISVAMGYAAGRPRNGEEMDALINEADHNMYFNKLKHKL